MQPSMGFSPFPLFFGGRIGGRRAARHEIIKILNNHRLSRVPLKYLEPSILNQSGNKHLQNHKNPTTYDYIIYIIYKSLYI